MHGAEKTGDTIEMVAVHVTDEDAVDAAPLHARAHELNLSAFAAVEEKDISIPDYGGGGEAAGQRRDGGAGAEKNNAHGFGSLTEKGPLNVKAQASLSGHSPQGGDSRAVGGRNMHT